MPNWCENTFTLRGEEKFIAELWKQMKDENKVLDILNPMPKELESDDGKNELCLPHSTAREKALQEKYGHDNWYDWCVDNWGTKWDVDTQHLKHSPGVIDGWFCSAWSPPIDAYQHFLEQNPGCEIEASYREPGNEFQGRFVNGVNVEYEDSASEPESDSESESEESEPEQPKMTKEQYLESKQLMQSSFNLYQLEEAGFIFDDRNSDMFINYLKEKGFDWEDYMAADEFFSPKPESEHGDKDKQESGDVCAGLKINPKKLDYFEWVKSVRKHDKLTKELFGYKKGYERLKEEVKKFKDPSFKDQMVLVTPDRYHEMFRSLRENKKFTKQVKLLQSEVETLKDDKLQAKTKEMEAKVKLKDIEKELKDVRDTCSEQEITIKNQRSEKWCLSPEMILTTSAETVEEFERDVRDNWDELAELKGKLEKTSELLEKSLRDKQELRNKFLDWGLNQWGKQVETDTELFGYKKGYERLKKEKADNWDLAELKEKLETLEYQYDMEKQCHEKEYGQVKSDNADLQSEISSLKEDLKETSELLEELKDRIEQAEEYVHQDDKVWDEISKTYVHTPGSEYWEEEKSNLEHLFNGWRESMMQLNPQYDVEDEIRFLRQNASSETLVKAIFDERYEEHGWVYDIDTHFYKDESDELEETEPQPEPQPEPEPESESAPEPEPDPESEPSDSDCYYNYDFCQFCCHEALGDYETDCYNCKQTMCIRRYQAQSRAEALKMAHSESPLHNNRDH